ncbi:hypothetical protein OG893_19535 [Streptomyces sp. NBC_01696]|uniref:hypothetical protein n=1 Tax=Streptomyces sp. NBC_01696 TaxID=2975913 RepID=UPI002E365B5E|nr:hypothetical protein [Streptomyces sp. NBC_01696]
MRLRCMVAAGAAVLALAAVSGCGGSAEGGGVPADGDGQSAGSGGRLMDGGTDGHRPQAATMADIETFVSQRTTCTDLHMEDKDSEHEDDPEAVGVGKLWGIKERGVCWGDDRNGVTLMSVDDMKSFQTQAKKHEQDGWYLLGEDFVVTGGSTTRGDLKGSGILAFVCDPEDPIPSGYKKEKALVDGCTLTDFIS